MTAPLIPQPFWFNVAFKAPRVDGIPLKNAKGRLLDLPNSCLLPNLAHLNGVSPWSQVWVGWNPQGLAISVEVTGKVGRIGGDPDQPQVSDGFVALIDTRDTRDIHRASRHCHRIQATLSSRAKGDAPEVRVTARKIARAQADAPTPDDDSYIARAAFIRQGWRVELFIPAANLNGFDPETNRRLGFNLETIDPDRGFEYVTGLGREFPQGEDPSLWATLDLAD